MSRRPVHPIPQIMIDSPQSGDDTQEVLELQPIPSISRLIQVEPINPEINEIQTNQSDIEAREPPFHSTNSNRNQVSIQPMSQLSCFNNKKYNKSLIGFSGSIIMSITIIAIVLFITWKYDTRKDIVSVFVHSKNSKYLSQVHSYYLISFCLYVGLPTLYFIFHPKHFIIAVKELPCSR